MPFWNEELQRWGYHFYEEVSSFQWLGIDRREREMQMGDLKRLEELCNLLKKAFPQASNMELANLASEIFKIMVEPPAAFHSRR